MRVFASRRYITGTAARRVAVLALLLPAFAASAAPVNFPLLPALPSDRASSGLLLEVARSGNRLVAVGERGRILWSDDGGQAWTQATVPVSLAITSVAFTRDGNAWATAHDGYLLRSADNGATWTIGLSGSDVAALSVGAIEKQVEALRASLEDASPDERQDIEWALDEALFALDEATLAVDEGMTTPLLKVWFADANTGYALGAYNVFLRTDDGGATWASHSYRLDNPDKYHLYDIARSTAGTLLLAGEAGTLLRSLDDGATWERIETPYPGSFFGTVATGDGGLLIFGLRGNVFRSMDEGASWVDVETHDSRTLMCGSASGDVVVLAGASGVVLLSRDAGKTFRVVPTEGSRVYSDLIMNPDGSVMLVGFGGPSILDAETMND